MEKTIIDIIEKLIVLKAITVDDLAFLSHIYHNFKDITLADTQRIGNLYHKHIKPVQRTHFEK